MAETKPKQNGPKVRKVPQRRCVGCGGTFDKKDLMRVVRAPLDPENPDAERLSIDFTGKKSGRGAYICKNESCFAKARKSGRLTQQLECALSDALYEELLKEIRLETAGE